MAWFVYFQNFRPDYPAGCFRFRLSVWLRISARRAVRSKLLIITYVNTTSQKKICQVLFNLNLKRRDMNNNQTCNLRDSINHHFIPFHFIPFHFIPFYSISFHFISVPNQKWSLNLYSNL